MTQRTAFIIFIIAALLAAAGIVLRSTTYPDSSQEAATQTTACANFDEAQLTVGERSIGVALATTPDQRSRGLGGCSEVPTEHGMYFILDQPKATTFWMKDMIIPIDIVWINQNTVIGIEHNVPPPLTPDTPTSDLTLYSAPGTVDAVLELAAGEAARLNIEPNTTIQLQ